MNLKEKYHELGPCGLLQEIREMRVVGFIQMSKGHFFVKR